MDEPPTSEQPLGEDGPQKRPHRLRILIVTFAVLIAIAVGAAALADKHRESSVATQGESSFSGEGCTSGPADAEVRVTIYGGESCVEWDRTQSASGTFWREVSFPTSNEEQLVCSMSGPHGHTLIEVRDTGEHLYGNRICASLTAEGWHETEGPGVKLEQSRKAHEAEQKAEAEQREAKEREAEEHKRAEENKRSEEQDKRETEHGEAEAKKSDEEAENTNREDLRKSEEEVRRGQAEAEHAE